MGHLRETGFDKIKVQQILQQIELLPPYSIQNTRNIKEISVVEDVKEQDLNDITQDEWVRKVGIEIKNLLQKYNISGEKYANYIQSNLEDVLTELANKTVLDKNQVHLALAAMDLIEVPALNHKPKKDATVVGDGDEKQIFQNLEIEVIKAIPKVESAICYIEVNNGYDLRLTDDKYYSTLSGHEIGFFLDEKKELRCQGRQK